jgi:NhaA family Na+:H+ antiporter
MKQHLNFLREFSIPLICGVLAAMVWANLAPAGYRQFVDTPVFGGLSFHFISNDIFMVFFFGIAAVEITQSCVTGGDLNPFSRAVNPLMATIGGVLGPVLLYWGVNTVFGSPEFSRGWGIPTATDIALAWLAARIVFGPAHPAVSYLLLLAVADDAIGMVIIALFYTDPSYPVSPSWLLLTVAGMGAAFIIRRLNVRNYWAYILVGGILSWIGLYRSHLHPALALVFIVPLIPHRHKESMHIFEDDPTDISPLARFEHEWKVVVDIGMFMFGVANAGVKFSNVSTVSWLVLFSLIVGKVCGIFSMGWLAAKVGFGLPRGMRRRDLLTSGLIAGTGFTVALFVAGEAFVEPAVKSAAKMGAIMSIVAAVLGVIAGKVTGVRKISN